MVPFYKGERRTRKRILPGVKTPNNILRNNYDLVKHGEDVAKLATAFSEWLYQENKTTLSRGAIDRVGISARFHDFGKSHKALAPFAKKTTTFTELERNLHKQHPKLSEMIVKNKTKNAGVTKKERKKIGRIVERHHERKKGRGYPEGYEGKRIPKEATILALADEFIGLTNPRLKHKKMASREEALQAIERNEKGKFPKELKELFIEFMQDKRD